MGDAYGANVKIFYVHGCSGSDGNTQDGTSGSNHFGSTGAYKTIQYAFDLVATGTIDDADEIHIMKTTNDALYYRPTAGIGVTWTSKDVAIHGSNATGAVDGTIVEIHGGSAGATALMYVHQGSGQADYCNFTNLYFNGANISTHAVHVKDQTNVDLNFINCRFSSGTTYGFESGVDSATDNNYMQLVNCRFDNNGGHGIEHPGANHMMVYKSLFDNNTGNGAYFGGNIKIAESVFYGNTGNGCRVSNGNNISNCIFDSNRGDCGLMVGGSRNGWGMNNIYSNNTGVGITCQNDRPQSELNPVFYNNGTGFTGNELKVQNMTTTGKVEFVDPANLDFTPKPTSSSIGAGQSQPFAYFGSTADDAGISKWVKTETISII